jgi:hypothetical protein
MKPKKYIETKKKNSLKLSWTGGQGYSVLYFTIQIKRRTASVNSTLYRVNAVCVTTKYQGQDSWCLAAQLHGGK